MRVSSEIKEAIKKVALGFTSEVVQAEYLTVYEFEEKMKKEYGREKRGKQGEVAGKKNLVDGQTDIFDVIGSDENNRDGGEDKKPKKGRPKDKFRMICVKKRVDQKYHPPEVSGLKMLIELEKSSDKSDIDNLVDGVKAMTMDELLEFRYKLLSDLSEKDEE